LHAGLVFAHIEAGSDLQLPASGAQGRDDTAVHEQVGAGDEAGVRPEEEGGGGGTSSAVPTLPAAEVSIIFR